MTEETKAIRKSSRQKAIAFFFENAGWSYTPGKETQKQGRRRCARQLAAAENWAKDNGYCFSWDTDSEPFECACDNPDCESHEPHTAWVCLMHDETGAVVQSCGGIDFGPDGEPWGDPYRRVMEAELALEQMTELKA